MEELVNKLAELQDRIVEAEHQTDADLEAVDKEIDTIKESLTPLMEHRKTILAPHMERIKLLNEAIDATKTQLIDEWDGDKKTIECDAGTLKFRTTQSLKIENGTLVLTGLLDHTSVKDVAKNYITGFNLTAVRKFMEVLNLPMGAAWIERKTTVKLEVSG
jgi:flagellin-like hook-associated protein FlgL